MARCGILGGGRTPQVCSWHFCTAWGGGDFLCGWNLYAVVCFLSPVGSRQVPTEVLELKRETSSLFQEHLVTLTHQMMSNDNQLD